MKGGIRPVHNLLDQPVLDWIDRDIIPMRAVVGFIPNPMRPSTGVARCLTRPACIVLRIIVPFWGAPWKNPA
ncbi:hypothetical protein [Nitrosomonas nitrosa]|uniref:hypothetical protein n=1 Tax=Nitrosomonas nitrosa TaxID=52442 RepID=UPI0023F65FC6|nr:hypothetical protein [Nitrosomonas nitrosa]MCO6435089.1 hypothetical protein [Nitrosomonas nitrosa]